MSGQGGEAAGVAVACQELRRDYGERTALRDVRLILPERQTLCVLGPNGAGKSTLLRVLASLLRPTEGTVSVLGCRLPAEAWRLRGRIGYLGHEALLYRELTARENLRFHARLHGLSHSIADQRIENLLKEVRLSAVGNETVSKMSAGMIQRLAVCRAVVHDPDLLLLDEPRSHLDPDGAALIEPLVGAESGRTRVLVTHDVDAGLAEADRVLALFHDGSTVFEGPAREFATDRVGAIYGTSERR